MNLSARDLVVSVRRALEAEVGQFRPRLDGLNLLSRLLPNQVGDSLRATILRQMGFQIGPNTIVEGSPKISGGERNYAQNLRIGSSCQIGIGCEFELGTTITIGDRVTLGHQVMIMTTTHELGTRSHRAGAIVRNPVTIESEALVGPRSTILPGVTIGEGAVVEAGSVVTKNVSAKARVGGNPARNLE